MGLLHRLRGNPRSRTAQTVVLDAANLVEVVGESDRQDSLRLVAARATDATPYLEDLSGHARTVGGELGKKWFRATLVPEPTNHVDGDSVAVYADGVGIVGHLTRGEAVAYKPVFSKLRASGSSVATCPAFLIGGAQGESSYGVMLCLSRPTTCVEKLRP